jgi:hypothetical protein
MKDKLIYFLSKYGNDFFHKLPMYKTAKYKGKYIKLIRFIPEDLTFSCLNPHTKNDGFPEISIFELDEFCL